MAIRGIDGSIGSIPVGFGRNPAPSSAPTGNAGGARAPKDVFSDARTSPVAIDPASNGAAGGPSGVTPSPQVVKTEHDLIKARQALGNAEQQLAFDKLLAQRDPFWGLMPWNWGKLGQDQKRVDQLTQDLAHKTQEESAELQTFGAAQVETARFQVFGEQLTYLENKYGKSTAARLAREVYYNDPHWDVASMSPPADEATLLQTGLPPKDDALMMAPNGDPVDMSHVAVAMDWQLNPPSILGIKSPVDIQDATLVGDLAQSSINTAVSFADAKKTDAKASLGDIAKTTFEGYANRPQLLGDIDGLNLASRLGQNPNARLSDLFNAYYSGGGPNGRMDELAASSPFIRKNGSVPVRDAQGNYVLDMGKLTDATMQFAKAMRDNEKAFRWIQGKDSSPRWANVTDAQLAQSVPAIVSGLFGPWFQQEQAQERPAPEPAPVSVEPRGHRGPYGRIS